MASVLKFHGAVYRLPAVLFDDLKKRIVNRRIDENLIAGLCKSLHCRRHGAVNPRNHRNPLRFCRKIMPPLLPGGRRLKAGRGRAHISIDSVLHAGPQGLVDLLRRPEIRIRHPKRKQHVTAASDIFFSPFRTVLSYAANGLIKIIDFVISHIPIFPCYLISRTVCLYYTTG